MLKGMSKHKKSRRNIAVAQGKHRKSSIVTFERPKTIEPESMISEGRPRRGSDYSIPGFYSNHIQNLTINAPSGFHMKDGMTQN